MTFNADVEFVNGGCRNQEIISLTLLHLNSEIYKCSHPGTTTCTDNSKVKVQHEKNGTLLIFRLSLTSVTASDRGDYEVYMRTSTRQVEETLPPLSFSLSVNRGKILITEAS